MGRFRPSTEAWTTYLQWNRVVAEVLFPEMEEPAPAYMDMEDDELTTIADSMGVDPSAVVSELAGAVRAVTVDPRGHFNLRDLAVLQHTWKRGENPYSLEDFEDYPPVFAFLAVAVLAAEQMGEDSDFAQNAYYPRLNSLLTLGSDVRQTQKQFSDYSEFLWASLNSWLQSLEGQRGLPSAYALSHRYVGLPMSQALLRSADRQRLPEVFDHMGLTAGMQLAPEDMEKYLHSWLSENNTAPRHLQKLWSKQSTRSRIAAVAALELSNWDGLLPEGRISTTTSSRVGLIGNLQRGFLGESFDLALMLKPTAAFDGTAETWTTDEAWKTLQCAPLTAGLWRTNPMDNLDVASLLEGVVRVRIPLSDSDVELVRRPRPVVPMVFDDLQSAYVEKDRVQLGVDCIVLARAQSETHPNVRPADEVDKLLTQHARPGFSRIEHGSMTGIPDGWVLFTGVQFFSAPQSARFDELVPLASTQLTLAGGFRIPSRVRKWSSLSPPEIRASAVSGGSLRIEFAREGAEHKTVWESQTGALVAPLSDLDLPDGDYSIALYTGDNDEPTQQAGLRLRSSDRLDPGWELTSRLAYSAATTAMGALSAGEEFQVPYIDGSAALGEAEQVAIQPARSDFAWVLDETRSTSETSIKLGVVDPTSCALTGAHRIELPTAYGGRSSSRFITGKCSSCGIVKQYPAWLPRNPRGRYRRRNPGLTDDAAAPSVVDGLTPVDQSSDGISVAALDTLMHLGGGEVASLHNVAAQFDGSSLFASTLINYMEWLGHIAVERDNRGRPTRWEISPGCAVALDEDTHLLTGFWPEQRRYQLASAAQAMGGDLSHRSRAGWFHGAIIQGVPASDVMDLFEENESLVESATESILAALPPLSNLGADLPRSLAPGYESLEQFDLATARWTPAADMSQSGAYRIKRGFERLNIFRSPQDCEADTVVFASASVVKHLAANDAGTSLLQYNRRQDSVLVPLGCELPGMYGRAAVLASGFLPATVKVKARGASRRAHSYAGFNEDKANLLNSLLIG